MMQIGGVDSFSIFEYNNKTYYMFGDVHNKINKKCDIRHNCDYFDYTFEKIKTYNSSCTSIVPLLKLWFIYNNYHNIKTDFYIEASYTNLDSYDISLFNDIIEERKKEGKVNTLSTIFPFNNMSWLQLAAFLFASCLTTDKTKCEFYPNVHLHYTDIRFVNKVLNTPFNISFLTEFTDENNFYLDFNEIKEDIVLIIKTLLKNYKFILEGVIFDKYEEMIFFLKSIPIKNSLVKNFYNEMIERYDASTVIRNHKKMHRVAAELLRLKVENYLVYEKLTKYIDNFKFDYVDYSVKNLENYILLNETQFLWLQSFMFDVYTLSRMFIQKESSEVITYTGLYHHYHFSEFFKNYLLVQPVFEKFTFDVNKMTFTNECIQTNYIDVNQFRAFYKYLMV